MTNIKEFLNAFSHDPNFALNFPFLWTVTIDGISKGAISQVLSKAEENWDVKTDPQSFTKSGGILVARDVMIPPETSTFEAYSCGSNMGGFLPISGMGSRANFLDGHKFTINFIETQMDIDHYFFRPWMIAIGIKGLVEDGQSLKGTIEVKQYSNQGSLIKGFKFKKVFPTAVEGYTLNYDSSDFRVNKSVTFACENYASL